jgi:pantoate--beta-alanine ligase
MLSSAKLSWMVAIQSQSKVVRRNERKYHAPIFEPDEISVPGLAPRTVIAHHIASVRVHQMNIISPRADLQALADRERAAGHTIALVPTMGALHAGHMSLVDVGHRYADKVWLSLFVNPTQFNDPKDFERYPDTRARDLELCEAAGVDVVWTPQVSEVYPDGADTWVEVRELSKPLCGATRPGHFLGVSTVVSKLFLAAKPHFAVFGEKDYQQLAIIRRMVRDMGFDLEIIGGPTIRESDGLALSSRNVHLGPKARREGLSLSRALDAAEALTAGGERDANVVMDAVQAELASASLGTIDYFELCDASSLAPVGKTLSGPTLLALAVYFASEDAKTPDASVRLIDNRVLLPAA